MRNVRSWVSAPRRTLASDRTPCNIVRQDASGGPTLVSRRVGNDSALVRPWSNDTSLAGLLRVSARRRPISSSLTGDLSDGVLRCDSRCVRGRRIARLGRRRPRLVAKDATRAHRRVNSHGFAGRPREHRCPHGLLDGRCLPEHSTRSRRTPSEPRATYQPGGRDRLHPGDVDRPPCLGSTSGLLEPLRASCWVGVARVH